MSETLSRPVLLSHASAFDVVRELARRLRKASVGLPEGGGWTRMDIVFASIVLVLALSSTGFFTATYRIVAADPNYFSRRLIASMELNDLDPIETGAVAATTAEASEGDGAGAMPVPAIHRERTPVPGDYEIVMIFGDEAMLATARELWRVKVGSVLPGLGAVLSIDDAQRVVRAESATLRMVAP